MNVLLTNNDLRGLAGSETWCITMYNELKKNHNVDIYTCGVNKLINGSPYNPRKMYDVAIINHRNCLNNLKNHSNIKRKIFTSHGVIPPLEQPIKGADVYVAVSEETRDNVIKKGFLCSKIMRNPIDMARFKSTNPTNETLKNILYISGYGNRPVNLIREACKGYNLVIAGSNDSRVSNMESYINNADLVISLGRGAYEAMSCDRNVVIFDSINNNKNHGDGIVTPDNIIEYRKNNCSGRNTKTTFNSELLRKEIEKYNCNIKMRSYIQQNNDVKLIVGEYLSLC